MNISIIKSFFIKLYISKFTYIFIFLCFITGLIKELLSLSLIIIFHEFGHYLVSYLYKWNIKKIIIYPFGGLIKYEEVIDKPFIEEFLITISGPINQLLFFFLIYILYKNSLLTDHFYSIIYSYNKYILIFNLIPIIPLDGSKILNIFINKIFNFRLSYILLIYISIFILFFLFKYTNNIFIMSYLLYEIINSLRYKNIVFNRFILEKYLYINNFKKIIKIDNINKMKRNKKYLLKYKNYYLNEKDYIKKIKGV